ncbi:hypothetical protein DVA67_021800 [Solirubrobacter sp. CPCC 204708]|uniref:TPM domain-containing protein n=1 Tax=Solirubrobacter deserti TaxID=2282478 RepID=A0ABT4REW0_9ACTN|nr:hypothetical protein [Solirubrobacter deserti]MBE2318628.1 hypothetical protein [Solirubrobacter deserti]MDA0137086.1 hypothetical protein [Solirubrobacter deserti]
MPRRLAVPAIALALALFGGGTARAQDRTDVFAASLKQSPVFVSDSVTRRVSDADRAALLREVERMPFPTYVVVAPYLSESLTGSEQLALLRDQLGEDGLYVYSDDRGNTLELAAFGVQLPISDHDITMAAYWDHDRDDPALEKLRYALALARGEPRMPKSQRARISPSEGGPMPTFGEAEEEDEEDSSLALPALGVFLLGGALSVTGLERLRRRRKQRPGLRANAHPEINTRERALNQHARLAREIARRRDPSERALELEAAASMALDRRSPIDDLGALVLAQRGREALKGAERQRCFFDPRHKGRATPTRWQSSRATIDVPACSRCAADIAKGEVPESVWDGERPYWKRDTVWARTGFGALREDMRRALAEDRS